MDATEQGYAVLRSFEGRALKAYRCPANVWTIGFGNTNHDKFAVAYLGRSIGAGLEITEHQAEYLLRESIRRNYAPAVAKAMPNAKPHEADAGISFHYNTGAISRASWVKHWLARNTAAMTPALLSWNKGGGRVLAGLDRRRRREDAMIRRADYGPEGRTKPPTVGTNGRATPASSPDHNLAGTPGMLRLGSTGQEVRDLKADLAVIGLDAGSALEVFDAATDKQVRKFQAAHKQLTVDGVAGPATRAALKREADAKRKLVQGGAGTAGPSGAAVVLDQATGGHLPIIVYLAMGALVLATLAYVGWKYRDELSALARRK